MKEVIVTLKNGSKYCFPSYSEIIICKEQNLLFILDEKLDESSSYVDEVHGFYIPSIELVERVGYLEINENYFDR